MRLRLWCPCASCRSLGERGEEVWPRSGSPTPLSITDAALHGAWGLAITWNDGHSTGIYPFEQLRLWSERPPDQRRRPRRAAVSVDGSRRSVPYVPSSRTARRASRLHSGRVTPVTAYTWIKPAAIGLGLSGHRVLSSAFASDWTFTGVWARFQGHLRKIGRSGWRFTIGLYWSSSTPGPLFRHVDSASAKWPCPGAQVGYSSPKSSQDLLVNWMPSLKLTSTNCLMWLRAAKEFRNRRSGTGYRQIRSDWPALRIGWSPLTGNCVWRSVTTTPRR